MSYLQLAAANLPDMSSGIISVWVKITGGARGPEAPWDQTWFPERLDETMGGNDTAYATASYYPVGLAQFGASRIVTWPPGGSIYSPGNDSFRSGLVPLLCFGDPNQKFDRCIWKKRTIGPPVWVFGRGGVPQNLVAQYPEPGPQEKDVVPPSCIGVYQGRLRIILQTNKKAKYTGYAWAQAKSETIRIMSAIVGQLDEIPAFSGIPNWWEDLAGRFPQPNQFMGYNFRYEDVSMLECGGHPEAFILDTDVQIADGQWHHILFAFDLGSGSGSGLIGIGGVPAADSGGGSEAAVYAESLGPDGTQTHDWGPALPGTWGQYSGIRGEYALAPYDYIINDPGYPGNVSYASQAAYGSPIEITGKYGPADNGKIESRCRAWLAVDDKPIHGRELNYQAAWDGLKDTKSEDGKNTGEALLAKLHPNAILPPNAFLAPFAEIRDEMKTNNTGWERDYRTLIVGFSGPASRIGETDELRRYDHARPRYEFDPGALPTRGHPVAIPAGTMFGSETQDIIDYNNEGIQMAELQIWGNQSLDFDATENRRLFLAPKASEANDDNPALYPVAMRKAAEKLGIPHIRLHNSSNWKKGYNTGTLGVRIVNPGPDQTKQKLDAGQFTPVGGIDRIRPDPKITPEK
jgi:hypothetical protein